MHPAWLLDWMGVAACGRVAMVVTEGDAEWEASMEVAAVARLGACRFGRWLAIGS